MARSGPVKASDKEKVSMVGRNNSNSIGGSNNNSNNNNNGRVNRNSNEVPHVVRITVLGVSGVHYNRQWRASLSDGGSTDNLSRGQAFDPKTMRAVLAFSRDSNQVGLSGLSQPLQPCHQHLISCIESADSHSQGEVTQSHADGAGDCDQVEIAHIQDDEDSQLQRLETFWKASNGNNSKHNFSSTVIFDTNLQKSSNSNASKATSYAPKSFQVVLGLAPDFSDSTNDEKVAMPLGVTTLTINGDECPQVKNGKIINQSDLDLDLPLLSLEQTTPLFENHSKSNKDHNHANKLINLNYPNKIKSPNAQSNQGATSTDTASTTSSPTTYTTTSASSTRSTASSKKKKKKGIFSKMFGSSKQGKTTSKTKTPLADISTIDRKLFNSQYTVEGTHSSGGAVLRVNVEVYEKGSDAKKMMDFHRLKQKLRQDQSISSSSPSNKSKERLSYNTRKRGVACSEVSRDTEIINNLNAVGALLSTVDDDGNGLRTSSSNKPISNHMVIKSKNSLKSHNSKTSKGDSSSGAKSAANLSIMDTYSDESDDDGEGSYATDSTGLDSASYRTDGSSIFTYGTYGTEESGTYTDAMRSSSLDTEYTASTMKLKTNNSKNTSSPTEEAGNKIKKLFACGDGGISASTSFEKDSNDIISPKDDDKSNKNNVKQTVESLFACQRPTIRWAEDTRDITRTSSSPSTLRQKSNLTKSDPNNESSIEIRNCDSHENQQSISFVSHIQDGDANVIKSRDSPQSVTDLQNLESASSLESIQKNLSYDSNVSKKSLKDVNVKQAVINLFTCKPIPEDYDEDDFDDETQVTRDTHNASEYQQSGLYTAASWAGSVGTLQTAGTTETDILAYERRLKIEKNIERNMNENNLMNNIPLPAAFGGTGLFGGKSRRLLTEKERKERDELADAIEKSMYMQVSFEGDDASTNYGSFLSGAKN